MKIIDVTSMHLNITLTRSDGAKISGPRSMYTELEKELLAKSERKFVYWYFGGLMEKPEFTWEVLCSGWGNTPVEVVQDAIDRGVLKDSNFLDKKRCTYWGCKIAFGNYHFVEAK